METINISEVKIPYLFLNSPVTRKKINKKVKRIDQGAKMSITIDSKNMLRDGYATLLAYDALGYKSIPFIQIEDKLPTKQEILERDKNTCYICGRQLESKELTIDHVIPRSKGGDSTENNVKCCCLFCNRLKGSFSYSETLAELIRNELAEMKAKKLKNG
jgi:hypothetical protein